MDAAQPQADLISGLRAMVQGVRENTQVPCVADCEFTTPEQAGQMAGIADGVTVGSALVKLLEQYGTQAPEHIGAYVKSMKEAFQDLVLPLHPATENGTNRREDRRNRRLNFKTRG